MINSAKALAGALLLASAAAVRADAAGDCRPDFLAAASYDTPDFPGTLFTEDLNLDGYPDLLVTTFDSSAEVSVRLGAADGSFGQPIDRSSAGGPLSATVGTFNAGSAPDLVISGYGAETRFLTGNGDGTFAADVPIPGAGVLRRLASADMNDDGNLDIVGIREIPDDKEIVVMLGNGNGTFGPPHVTATRGIPPAFALGDLDGDDLPDLVAPTGFNSVSVFLGLGNGDFAPPSDVIAGVGLGAIALADVSGDGARDMILTSVTYVGVLIGNGDGTFQAARDYSAPVRPHAFALGDFDGDGDTDIVAITNPAYPSGVGVGIVLLLKNDGGGVFASGPAVVAGLAPTEIQAADFGNDGRMDFAVVSPYQDQVTVVRGDGDGTFQAVRATATLPAAWAPALRGDFDEDGLPDLAASLGSAFRIVRSLGDGAFGPGPVYSLTSYAAMTSADFNADGHLDLAFLNDTVPALTIFLGNGDLTFEPEIVVDLPVVGFNGAIAAGDFDGDGVPDLAAVAAEFPPGTGGDLLTLHGNGDGDFGPPIDTPLLAPGPYQLLAGKFNGDGLSDLALLGNFPNTDVGVYLSQGDGTFANPNVYDLPARSSGMAAADLGHSGHLDLIVGNPDGGTDAITILPGQGDGTFAAPVVLVIGAGAFSIDTADFDGDGNMDIVTANYLTYDATVLFGLGTGAFQAPQAYAVGSPLLVFAGDFDGNGLPDAAFMNANELAGPTTLLNGGLAARVGDESVLVGDPVTLSASAGGFGPLAYQWRKNGAPLSDGGPVSGSQTATLTIDPVSFSDAGSYDVVVTDDCGSAPSNTATLAVEFADVPVASIFHDDILAIATAGITSGCGGAHYCPTSSVRRDQMAVFLLKAEHGSAYTPPVCTGIFADVPCPSAFADWVEQLSAEGITGGCGGGNYCPGASVTRAQMAVFLLKTLLGSAYTPPAATGIFSDVPVGSFAADFIEDLYNRGITGGCSASPLLYCPNNAVLRQQMATFLVRTFLGP